MLQLVPPAPPPDVPPLEELIDEEGGTYIGIYAEPDHWLVGYGIDLGDYIKEISGKVCVFNSGGGKIAELGRFKVLRIDVDSAIADQESVFDVFDYSSSTIDYFDLYIRGGWEFKEAVLRDLRCVGEYVPCGLLIIDRLELYPKYRGRGVGLDAMKAMIVHFRMGAGIVAIKPFPLQFEGGARDEPETLRRRGLDQYPGDEARCKRRLMRHYATIGFRRILRTPYMGLPLIRRLEWLRG